MTSLFQFVTRLLEGEGTFGDQLAHTRHFLNVDTFDAILIHLGHNKPGTFNLNKTKITCTNAPWTGKLIYVYILSVTNKSQNVSRSAQSLILQLTDKDPDCRLGSSREDAESIKRHDFFKGIDWNLILTK